ncbi:unnamed protein product [Effrenium voratum]|uniref:Uncharacterized protein n=1 Tax=Effrenium voratum TaxID=2562239 RepID=A0AA36IKQ8_9DINO|nr:unnamed protein product [Effrenium voratum]CAJ1460736.1 unnamed protein product [Effrenium voratum]
MTCHALHQWSHFSPFGWRAREATAFGDVPEEEGRQEPAWPDILPIYLKKKLKHDMHADVDAALRKVGATRAAGRSKVEQQKMEEQLDKAKETAEELSRQPAESQEAEKEKLAQMQGAMRAKQEVLKHEMGATEQWLSAHGRRDFAEEEQLEAQENEVRIKDAIKEAETEAQRRVKGRNTIVGTKAENKFGMKITTKQACDQEKGTEWHLGKCIVSGESQSPDTPEEVAAVNAVKTAQTEYDESLELVHDKNHALKDAERKMNHAKMELQVYQNHHDNGPKLAEHQAKLDAAKAAWESAHDTLNDAKKSSAEKRQTLSAALRHAIDVEKDEEGKDEVDLHSIDEVKNRAESDVHRSEEQIADLEEEQAQVVGGMAQKLRSEAMKHEMDSSQRRDLEQEATWLKQWQHDAEAEAHDLHDGNLQEYVKDHVREQQDAQRENDASHKAFADAAAEGRDQEAFEKLILKPPDESEKQPQDILHEENEHLEKLIKTDAGAGDDDLKATREKSKVQSHKNAIEFREFSNVKALHDASKASKALMAPALLLPRIRDRRRGRGFL